MTTTVPLTSSPSPWPTRWLMLALALLVPGSASGQGDGPTGITLDDHPPIRKSDQVSPGRNAGIAGLWVRVADDYAGWVIEIGDAGRGDLEARSLWVPTVAKLNGFQIGEKKMRSIRSLGGGGFLVQSMRRIDEEASYESMEMTVPTADTMLLLSDTPSGTLGDKQRWKRVRPGSVEYAYASFGRGVILQDRDRFEEASRAYATAADVLLDAPRSATHGTLANQLAWKLAVSPRGIQDPRRALQLEPLLPNTWNSIDTAAAIHAANGDFKRALQLEDKALALIEENDAVEKHIRSLGLNDKNVLLLMHYAVFANKSKTDFSKRRALYESGQRAEE